MGKPRSHRAAGSFEDHGLGSPSSRAHCDPRTGDGASSPDRRRDVARRADGRRRQRPRRGDRLVVALRRRASSSSTIGGDPSASSPTPTSYSASLPMRARASSSWCAARSRSRRSVKARRHLAKIRGTMRGDHDEARHDGPGGHALCRRADGLRGEARQALPGRRRGEDGSSASSAAWSSCGAFSPPRSVRILSAADRGRTSALALRRCRRLLGASARYWVGGWAADRLGTAFPYGTFIINMSGSFAIGLLAAFFAERAYSPNWRLFLMVGVLGGTRRFPRIVMKRCGCSRMGPTFSACSTCSGVRSSDSPRARQAWRSAGSCSSTSLADDPNVDPPGEFRYGAPS